MAQLGLPEQDETQLIRFIGPPLVRSFATLLAELGADPGLAPDALAAYRSAYPALARRHTRVIHGIPVVLARLAERHELRVVTSKPRPFALPIVAAAGLGDLFADVHGPEADELDEPKERTLAAALASARVPGQRTVMVGDHAADILAGRANGTATIGVTWGTGARIELEEAGADAVVEEPTELLDRLG